MASDTALMVIDVQIGLIEEGAFEPDRLINNVKALIDKARSSDIPVIFVQHSADWIEDSLHPSKPTFAIHPAIAPQAGDTVVQKHNPDAFQDTNLQAVLAEMGIKKLVVAGMQTEMCVDTSCRAAFSRGYEVTLAGDAHTTFDSGVLKATDIIKHHNNVMNDSFAKVKPTAEIEFA